MKCMPTKPETFGQFPPEPGSKEQRQRGWKGKRNFRNLLEWILSEVMRKILAVKVKQIKKQKKGRRCIEQRISIVNERRMTLEVMQTYVLSCSLCSLIGTIQNYGRQHLHRLEDCLARQWRLENFQRKVVPILMLIVLRLNGSMGWISNNGI